MSGSFDDEFSQYIAATEEENNRRGSFSGSGDFDEIKWAGLEKGKYRIIRLLGKTPNVDGSARVNTGAMTIVVSGRIRDDDGKTMIMRLPADSGDPDNRHLIHRIISAVMEKEWVSVPGEKKRVGRYKNDLTHPDIFNIVSKGGWPQDSNQWQYNKGWKGQQVTIFNCIDREDMDWHRANKKTKLLSKRVSVSVNSEGKTVEYSDVGIPAFGMWKELKDVGSAFGNWENYDVAIMNTGEMNPSIRIKNISRYVEKDMLDEFNDKNLACGMAKVRDVVSVGPLTDEEKSWEQYDITKYYSPTGYRVILKRLGKQIKKIDAALGRSFYDELVKLADEEKAAADASAKADAESVDVDKVETSSQVVDEAKQDADVSAAPPAPARSVARAADQPHPDDSRTRLAGWGSMTDSEKSQVASAEFDPNGKCVSIRYVDGVSSLVACPECRVASPASFHVCPSCGVEFE